MPLTDYYVCEENAQAVTSGEKETTRGEILELSKRFCLDALSRPERITLEAELALAARIQQSLFPAQAFSRHGWEIHHHHAPAGLLSGDYCDIFEFDSRVFFLLGDVSGKGVAASMLMSQLYATFRSLAHADLPLTLMVETANRLFTRSTLAGQFATLVVGCAEPDGAVEFVNAGHLPLLKLSRGTLNFEFATGIPLGVFSDVRFPARRLRLEPGESLLLYTDGITESQNSVGEEYGAGRIERLAFRHSRATPSRLISACLADLRVFTAGEKQNDDLALLAIRRIV